MAALGSLPAGTGAPALEPPGAGPPAIEARAFDPLTTHADLQQWRTGPPLAVPEGGLTWQREGASFHLEAGDLRLQEPTAAGLVTGFVFEGRGRFSLEIPDDRELDHVRRQVGEPELGRFDTTFSRLVVRTGGGLPFPTPGTAGAPRPDRLLRRRHEHWLRARGLDIDARVVASLAGLGAGYFRADLETAEHGWLTWEIEPLRNEELHLERYRAKSGFVEVWVSLDRAEDRLPGGRPAPPGGPDLDIARVEIDGDLTRAGRDPRQGRMRVHPVGARFRAGLELAPVGRAAPVLALELHPWGRVEAVRLDGDSVPFLRERIGDRFRTLDDRLNVSGLWVFPGEPLRPGSTAHLEVEYEMELQNYAPGRAWYPGTPDGFEDRHTGSLRLTLPEDRFLEAMGTLVDRAAEDGRTTTTWEVSEPVKMLTFAFAERARRASAWTTEGAEVAVTSPAAADPRSVADDVAHAFDFFTRLFADPLGVDRVVVTSIAGGHGQAFRGFLHLAEIDFLSESGGPSERFRAHEVAHHWWGHRIGFAGYREQWLSEATAEYSALLFLESEIEGGRRYRDEVLRVYREEIVGSLRHSMSRFARPFLIHPGARHDLERLGPISFGWRAATGDIPGGWSIHGYHKGALVLHTLRRWLQRDDPEGVGLEEEAFVALLRETIHELDGLEASTADLARRLERRTGSDWGWFFEQWVDRVELPSLRWRAAVETAADGSRTARLELRREGVPPGFRQLVPVTLRSGRDGDRRVDVVLDRDEATLEIPLLAAEDRLEVDPDGILLGRVRRLD